jgi:hypothetical protein
MRFRRGAAQRAPMSGSRKTMRNPVTPPRSERLPGDQKCQHRPQCPDALAPDRIAARAVASHFEQGWSLLCNGVVLFEDGGAFLPDRRAVAPASAGIVRVHGSAVRILNRPGV